MNILFSIWWLFSDMTKSPSHIALTAAFVLMIILFNLLKNEEFMSGSNSLFIVGFMLIAVGGLEMFAHINFHDDPTWILGSFGNFFFGMIVFAAAFFMMYAQYHFTKNLLQGLSYAGTYNNKYNAGFSSVIVAAIAYLIVGFIDQQSVMYVIYAFFAFQLYVVGYAIYSTIDNDGDVAYALFSVVVYIACIGGLMFLFIHFIVSAIFAAILMAIGSAKTSCSDCRSYRDGYCYYRKQYVSGSDNACNKYQH